MDNINLEDELSHMVGVLCSRVRRTMNLACGDKKLGMSHVTSFDPAVFYSDSLLALCSALLCNKRIKSQQ